MLAARLSRAPRTAADAGVSVPPALESVIARCLCPEPDDRTRTPTPDRRPGRSGRGRRRALAGRLLASLESPHQALGAPPAAPRAGLGDRRRVVALLATAVAFGWLAAVVAALVGWRTSDRARRGARPASRGCRSPSCRWPTTPARAGLSTAGAELLSRALADSPRCGWSTACGCRRTVRDLGLPPGPAAPRAASGWRSCWASTGWWRRGRWPSPAACASTAAWPRSPSRGWSSTASRPRRRRRWRRSAASVSACAGASP